MMNAVERVTIYDPEQKMILTRLCGTLVISDIDLWQQSLQTALEKIPDGGTFRILVDLHGFTAASFEAHKHFRTIIPLTLAMYGWKVGYIALFEEAATVIGYGTVRDIRCTAAAHVHHDATKIGLYQASFGSEEEAFFTDAKAALNWLQER